MGNRSGSYGRCILSLSAVLVILTAVLVPCVSTPRPRVRVLVAGTLYPPAYPRFYELLASNEFEVAYLDLTKGDVTLDVLSEYDILVIGDVPTSIAGPDDTRRLATIVEWVKKGGSLLVDSSYLYEPGIMGAPFSVVTGFLGYNETLKPISIEIGDVEPFNYEAGAVEIRYYSPLAVGAVEGFTRANPLLVVGESGNITFSFSAYAELGEGRAVILPLSYMADNFYLFAGDNAQFIVNIFNWLAHRAPRKADLGFQERRYSFYSTLAAAVSLVAALVVLLSYKLTRFSAKLYWAVLALLGAILVVQLLYEAYVTSTYLGLGLPLNYLLLSDMPIIVSIISLAAVVVALKVYKDRVDARLLPPLLAFSLGVVVANVIVSVFNAYFALDNIPFTYNFTRLLLSQFSTTSLLLLGMPALWLAFREKFEEWGTKPVLSPNSLSRETYEDVFYGSFYPKYVFIAMATSYLTYTLPVEVVFVTYWLWGGKGLASGWAGLYSAFKVLMYFVMALVVAFLVFRKAIRGGLRDRESLQTLNFVLFAREYPYLLLAIFVVPAVVGHIVSLLAGYQVSTTELALSLAGVFLGYVVGYSALWLYFKGVKEATTTIATGLLVLGYQWLVNQAFLKEVSTFLERTALSGVIAIAIAGFLKKMLSEFTKEAIAPPKKPHKPTREEELKGLLEKLDKALIEGRISEETYRELKEKYERELESLRRGQSPTGA